MSETAQEIRNLRARLEAMTAARDELGYRVVVAESLLTDEQLQQVGSQMDRFRWERDVPEFQGRWAQGRPAGAARIVPAPGTQDTTTEEDEMTQFGLTIKAVEDVEDGGESMSPPRLVAGSFVDLDVTDEDGISVWSAYLPVQAPTVDPADITRAALEVAGFSEIEIADEWMPGNVMSELGSPIYTTGTLSRGPTARAEDAALIVPAPGTQDTTTEEDDTSDTQTQTVGWRLTPATGSAFIACDGCASVYWRFDGSIARSTEPVGRDEEPEELDAQALTAADLEPGTTCDVCDGGHEVTAWTGEQWLSSVDGPTVRDAESGEALRKARPEEIIASAAAPEGVISIDADGDLVDEGSWDAQQPGCRRVRVAAP